MEAAGIVADVVLVTAIAVSFYFNRRLWKRADQEIRERQGANNTTTQLVTRQGRALSEHIESNLHR